jgi:hypothetical protein
VPLQSFGSLRSFHRTKSNRSAISASTAPGYATHRLCGKRTIRIPTMTTTAASARGMSGRRVIDEQATKPQDSANLVAFLLSKEGASITGQLLHSNGVSSNQWVVLSSGGTSHQGRFRFSCELKRAVYPVGGTSRHRLPPPAGSESGESPAAPRTWAPLSTPGRPPC